VEARQANGAPLPSWLRFDPVTGTFTGKVPAGFQGEITIEIIIRDSKGNRASSNLEINVGSPLSMLMPVDLDALFATPEIPAAKPALASQFAQFGRPAWEAEAQDLMRHLQSNRG
jgi:hypothetical protein